MRSSRISKDTTKLFDRPASPPRRTTRSLARFALAAAAPASALANPPPDIEDGIHRPAKRQRQALSGSTARLVKSEVVVVETPSKGPGRARKPAHQTSKPGPGPAAVSPPSGWEDMYQAVRRMRAPGGVAHGAPVDTMGCERLADKQASPKDRRFHTLVALMLSSQTKDTINAVAMHRLKTEMPAYEPGAPAGLNLDNMLAVDAALLNQLICAVGFHNNKTKYLKQAAVMLRDRFHGDIPDTIEGLTSLPGVGPKMAHLCMSAAWDVTLGIGVDVHVHRITNLWAWHRTKTPEETRLALESWLPRDRWREINWLLVGFGQEVCRPVGRRCGDCDLGLQGLCRAADRGKVIAGRKATQAAAGIDHEAGVETRALTEQHATEVKDGEINHTDVVVKTRRTLI